MSSNSVARRAECGNGGCDWGGCHGHDYVLEVRNTSDTFTFYKDGQDCNWPLSEEELELLIQLAIELDVKIPGKENR